MSEITRSGGIRPDSLQPGRALGLLAAMGVVACGTETGASFEYGFEPIALVAELHYEGDNLGIPIGLRVAGRHLIAIDQAGDKNVHVLDAETGRHRVSVGAVGEGPAEFRVPIDLISDGEAGPWVLDGGAQRAIRLNLDGLDDGTAWAAETVTFGEKAITGAVRTDRRTWIVNGIFPGGRFGVLDPEGALIAFRGDIPGTDAVSAVAAQQMHYSALDAHPDLDRFVMVGRNYSEIFFLNRDAEIVGRADPPIIVEPDFVVRGDRVGITTESPVAYSDVAVSREHVYALFSGRSDAEFGAAQNHGRDVHVFDWEGRLVTVLRLDRDVLTLEVDEDHGRLYAVQLDPTPAILRFALPETLSVDSPPGTALVRLPGVP